MCVKLDLYIDSVWMCNLRNHLPLFEDATKTRELRDVTEDANVWFFHGF